MSRLVATAKDKTENVKLSRQSVPQHLFLGIQVKKHKKKIELAASKTRHSDENEVGNP